MTTEDKDRIRIIIKRRRPGVNHMLVERHDCHHRPSPLTTEYVHNMCVRTLTATSVRNNFVKLLCVPYNCSQKMFLYSMLLRIPICEIVLFKQRIFTTQ